MRLVPLLLLVATAAGAAAAEPREPRGPSSTGNINGYLGVKQLDHDDWDPVEGHGAIGVLFDVQPPGWPVALAINLILSGATDEDDGTGIDTTGTTSELQIGVKKVWFTPGATRFALAGGVDLVGASREIDINGVTTDDDDGGLGLWASAALYWTFGAFNIGPQVTWSTAQVELFDQEVDAGGIHLGVLLGYHW